MPQMTGKAERMNIGMNIEVEIGEGTASPHSYCISHAAPGKPEKTRVAQLTTKDGLMTDAASNINTSGFLRIVHSELSYRAFV